MWESGISKANYPEVGEAAAEAYQLLEQAATELLPKAPAARQKALVATAWSVVHGYATLSLEQELPENQKLLRQSLHLLLDQFAE
jgi:Tetracyclin repressor-like, C-terminal domain